MAPSVDFTIDETPGLPLPPWLPSGQVTVDPEPSFHTEPAAFARYPVKLCVVPELSERRAMVIFVDGSLTPALSAAMARSFQVVTSPWKIFASVAAVNFSGLLTLETLYDTVIGALTVGTYRKVPPLILLRSAAGYGPSVAPHWVT